MAGSGSGHGGRLAGGRGGGRWPGRRLSGFARGITERKVGLVFSKDLGVAVPPSPS